MRPRKVWAVLVFAAVIVAAVLGARFGLKQVDAGPAPDPLGIVQWSDGSYADADGRIIDARENYRRSVAAWALADARHASLRENLSRAKLKVRAQAGRIADLEERVAVLEAPTPPPETGNEARYAKKRAVLKQEAETVAAVGAEVFAAAKEVYDHHNNNRFHRLAPVCAPKSQRDGVSWVADRRHSFNFVVGEIGWHDTHRVIASVADHDMWMAYVGSRVVEMEAQLAGLFAVDRRFNDRSRGDCALAVLRGDPVVLPVPDA